MQRSKEALTLLSNYSLQSIWILGTRVSHWGRLGAFGFRKRGTNLSACYDIFNVKNQIRFRYRWNAIPLLHHETNDSKATQFQVKSIPPSVPLMHATAVWFMPTSSERKARTIWSVVQGSSVGTVSREMMNGKESGERHGKCCAKSMCSLLFTLTWNIKARSSTKSSTQTEKDRNCEKSSFCVLFALSDWQLQRNLLLPASSSVYSLQLLCFKSKVRIHKAILASTVKWCANRRITIILPLWPW